MRRNLLCRFALRSAFLIFSVVLLHSGHAAGQNSDPLRVQAEVSPGPYLVGQGFELRVGVIAGGQRPKVDPPRLAGARAWSIGTEVRPVTATGIGSVVTQENRFVFRFRVVPTRAGTLEVPSIRAQVKGRSGRSQPKSLTVQPVPLQGRPADFLGGVGRLEVEAEAVPKVVRVGQELDFRIKVTGPAAWGMNDRPDLGRFGRSKLGLRIEPKPDETSDEPPARTFVYRLRPTQAGEAVLPPVAIAAYDPSLSRYVTHVTAGVPIRVVAVPSFDPATTHFDSPSDALSWPARAAWAIASLTIVLLAVYMLLRRMRRRFEHPLSSPELARRFAKKTVRYIGSLSAVNDGQPSDPGMLAPQLGAKIRKSRFQIGRFRSGSPFADLWVNRESAFAGSKNGAPTAAGVAAREIYELLASYLMLGTGISVGVLTPEEARHQVGQLTSSDELARAAGELTARCDKILYGEITRGSDTELSPLLDDACRLFESLGQVKYVRRPGG
jgi:hypothetical protein